MLEQIYQHKHLFDVVVIIRGGGASSDLNSFDSYLLATNCAQFPLPIISGVGHERDVTVLDTVAHTRVKTPTAAAEFLINTAAVTINHLIFLQDSIVSLSRSILIENESQLNALSKDLYYHSRALLHNSDSNIILLKHRLKGVVMHSLEKERFDIQRYEHFVSLSLPENMLKRGYTITTRNGKTIKSISDIAVGEVIQTRFLDGEVDSKIIEKK